MIRRRYISPQIVESLRGMKNVVIIHHDDADGRSGAAACAIACKAYWGTDMSKIKYIECNYKDEIDYYSLVDKGDLLIVVDYSLDPKLLTKIINDKVGKRVILLDHHKSSFEKYRNFKTPYHGIMEYISDTINAISGVELAYEYFGLKHKVDQEFVRLIGEFDTWRHEKTGNKDALYFVYAVKHYNVQQMIQLLEPHYDKYASTYISRGADIYFHIQEENKSILEDFAFETKLKGYEQYSCIALNTANRGSMIFGEKLNDYDLCITYLYDGKNYAYSIYSTKVDVSEIATSFGGGGHPGASGFTIKENIL